MLSIPALLYAPATSAVDEFPPESGPDTHEALGIAPGFGRWNRTIRFVYDPDGAPALYANDATFLAVLDEACAQWERVSGIRFEVVGVDRNIPDDYDLQPNQRDGFVRVFWNVSEVVGAAGRAGPARDYYDSNLGYMPYHDGHVELNPQSNMTANDLRDLVLVHELGHLIGLGHSDNPESVMFANPYNQLKYPRPDDIRAVQALYGAPAVAFDIDVPVTDWAYAPPPQAPAATTAFLLKANQHPDGGSGAYFKVKNVVTTLVSDNTPSGEYVWLYGAVGGFGNPATIALAATMVLVDPRGYVYRKEPWKLECTAGLACATVVGVTWSQFIKTVPGTWRVYVVDEAANQTLATLSLPAVANASFNQAPLASMTLAPGATATQAQFTLKVTDPEGNPVAVIWHPPGQNDLSGTPITSDGIRTDLASGGEARKTFDFALAGTHTFFVEVIDTVVRYGDGPGACCAGSGFQTLLKVVVTLPALTAQVVSNQVSAAANKAVLTAVARTPATQQYVVSSNSMPTTAAFMLGASSDQGMTTQTSFATGGSVVIAGAVNPQLADLGKAADVFVVVRTTTGGVESWTYRNSSGVFVPWPTVAIANLQPAYNVASLKPNEAFEIYNGGLVAARHRAYIGYRLSGGSVLHYTGQALNLNVGN